MRKLRSRKTKKSARIKPRKPLTEGIVPLRKNGHRKWASLGDEELIALARRFMKENGISRRGELGKVDRGIYHALWKRKLLDKVGFEERMRPKGFFTKMSDDDLVAFTKRSIKKRGIVWKTELKKVDSGLYEALKRRKLLDKLEFERKRQARPRGFFSELSDVELIAFAEKYMDKNGIVTSQELEESDRGLYLALMRRGVLCKVGFYRKYRSWASMNDEEVMAFAKEFIEKNGIRWKSELMNADGGLYSVLLKRELLDKMGFEEKRRKQRDWDSLSDAQLVEHAKQFMKEKGIRTRRELAKADCGLYDVLRRRKLLGKISFEERRRSWVPMSDEELVAFAKKVVEEKNLMSRWELGKVDYSFYEVLRKRNLLDRVFEDIDQTKEREEIQQIVVALEEFNA